MYNYTSSYPKTLILLASAFLAGIVNVFGYAPFNLWYLSFAAITTLCILLSLQSHSTKLIAGIVFSFALSSNLGSLFWLHQVLAGYGEMPMVLVLGVILLFAAYLALFPTGFIALGNICFKKQATRRILLVTPIMWVLGEELSGWLFTGFPWSSLAYTQIESIFRHLAPLTGAAGITWALVFVAATTALFIRQRRLIYLFTPICLTGLLLWLGTIVYTDNLTPVKTALMQGNIPTETKWNPELIAPTFKTYFKLLDENKDAQIIVWPESAIPVLENQAVNLIKTLDAELAASHTSLITGVQYYDHQKETFYNGVIGLGLMDRANTMHYEFGQSNRYYKRHLVPIGEFVPFESVLRLLGPIFNMPMSSFTRGPKIQPNIVASGLNVATAICYEIIFSGEMRHQITKDTNLIVTVSNDGWFSNTNGPYQHLNIARMRAMEFRKPILRATNNGVTAVIDSLGNVLKTIPENKETTLRTEFVPTQGQTPYARFGELPMWVAFIFFFILCLANRLSKLVYITLYKIQARLFKRIEHDYEEH